MEKLPENDHYCYCCGDRNERGLHLKFTYPEEGSAFTETKIPGYYTGWKSVVHGGYLAMLLDETMAHACVSLGKSAFTAEITVRYHKPAKVGDIIHVHAKVDKQRSKIIDTSARIFNSDDVLIAESKARFMAP